MIEHINFISSVLSLAHQLKSVEHKTGILSMSKSVKKV